jgi:O-antigen/teichoic acid export membrane protein
VNNFLGRVVAAMGAGAFGQAVIIIIQIFSLPLFLQRWDTVSYGTWLLLSAMPSYLSMTDVGMVATAGNRMSMAMGKGDKAEANTLFHSAFMFVLIVSGVALLLTIPVTLTAPIESLSSQDERVAVCALIAGVLVAQFGGLSDALYRATGRFALAMMLGNILRLAEWGGFMAGLYLDGSFSSVALGGLIARATGTVFLVQISKSGDHGLTWHWRNASMDEIKSLFKPAISFMVFPLSSALSLQGITILVGHFFGPAVVAIFNSYRTIARVAVQVSSILGNALWGEFSFLYGKGGAEAIRSVYKRSCLIGIGGSIGLSLILYFTAPTNLRVWSHGHIPFQNAPMMMLLAYAAIAGIWHVPRVLLLSTNQHIGLAQWSLAGALMAVAATFLLQKPLGLEGVCLAMVISELFMATVCIRLARDFVHPVHADTPGIEKA